MKKTARNHEAFLNELFSDTYNEREAIERFEYLNNGKVQPRTIVNAHTNHELGTLLRKHDPIAFNASYNEWSMEG